MGEIVSVIFFVILIGVLSGMPVKVSIDGKVHVLCLASDESKQGDDHECK